MFLVALTGPVCAGKTTLAKKLSSLKDFKVIHLNEFIKKKKLYDRFDKRWKAYVVDVKKLSKFLNDEIKKLSKEEIDFLLIESHLIPELNINFDIAVILDVNEKILYQRMKKRRYTNEKIEENLIAFHLDYFWIKTKAKHKFRFKPKFNKADKKKLLNLINRAAKKIT
jgi:adenylate kinase